MSSWHWAIRIAAWLALAVIYAIAFHYAKQYESDMLTDHSQDTVALPDTRNPAPIFFDRKPGVKRHKSAPADNAGDANDDVNNRSKDNGEWI